MASLSASAWGHSHCARLVSSDMAGCSWKLAYMEIDGEIKCLMAWDFLFDDFFWPQQKITLRLETKIWEEKVDCSNWNLLSHVTQVDEELRT